MGDEDDGMTLVDLLTKLNKKLRVSLVRNLEYRHIDFSQNWDRNRSPELVHRDNP